MSLRTIAPLSPARMKGSDTEALHTYFDMLEHTLSSNDLADKPCQIYNMDETGMPLDPKAPKLVCRAGSRNPVSISSGDESQISVVGCVSTGGLYMTEKFYIRICLKVKLQERCMDCHLMDGWTKSCIDCGSSIIFSVKCLLLELFYY